MQPDVIVVGAGFSGCVMAERFASVLDKQVLVLEQRDHIGGNCFDYHNEHGICVHHYGPHLFHTNKTNVWDYLSNFTEWQPYEHEVLSSVDGRLVPLPFNLNTLSLLYPADEALHIEKLLIEHYGEGSKVSILTLKDCAEPELNQLGKLVYEKFFVNYTTKQWGCSPDDISPAVLGRVPVVISRDNRYFHDKYQAIPLKGYTAMFERMLEKEGISVELQQDAAKRLQFNIQENRVTFDDEPFHGVVIYTGMIDALFNYCNGELPYRSLQFDFETLNVEQFQPKTTVNYPNEQEFTRITEFKHILPVTTEFTTIVREFPQDFDRHDPNKNIPYYPMFNEANQKAHNSYRLLTQQLSQLHILGRLADYKYYNMDDAVANALTLFEEKFANQRNIS